MDHAIGSASLIAWLEGHEGLAFPDNAHDMSLLNLVRRVAALERRFGGITQPPPFEAATWNAMVWRLWRLRFRSSQPLILEKQRHVYENAAMLTEDYTMARLRAVVDSLSPELPLLTCPNQEVEDDLYTAAAYVDADGNGSDCAGCMGAAVQKLAYVAGQNTFQLPHTVLSKGLIYAFAAEFNLKMVYAMQSPSAPPTSVNPILSGYTPGRPPPPASPQDGHNRAPQRGYSHVDDPRADANNKHARFEGHSPPAPPRGFSHTGGPPADANGLPPFGGQPPFGNPSPDDGFPNPDGVRLVGDEAGCILREHRRWCPIRKQFIVVRKEWVPVFEEGHPFHEAAPDAMPGASVVTEGHAATAAAASSRASRVVTLSDESVAGEQSLHDEPEAVRAEPEPVRAEPEPVRAEPEPVRAEPEPVRAEPEPVREEPEPVREEPEAVHYEPEPVCDEPEAAAERPMNRAARRRLRFWRSKARKD